MQSITQLAVSLDIGHLLERGVNIHAENVPANALPVCDPYKELGGRLLIKYIPPNDVDRFSILTGVSQFSGQHWLTPTPIAPKDLVSALALPFPDTPRTYALLLDPKKLTDVRGPRRINRGLGVEYILMDGFSTDAIADPGWVISLED